MARDITNDSDLDVIAIATPVSTHFNLAKSALESGKHVWVEKPITETSNQAKTLSQLAESKGLTLMVDHTFLFTGSVQTIKTLVDEGQLGDLYYYDSVRINLGLFQPDVNVVWDLAPHDFSIVDYLFESPPIGVSTHARGHFGTDFEDVAYVTVFYPDDFLVHLHLNWLSPVKIRRTVVGGSKKMLVWDDLNSEDQIKLYDKGMEVESQEGRYRVLARPRYGDMHSPAVAGVEALQSEVAYFVSCISSGETPFNDGRAGLRVIRLLEATDESLRNDGQVIALGPEEWSS